METEYYEEERPGMKKHDAGAVTIKELEKLEGDLEVLQDKFSHTIGYLNHKGEVPFSELDRAIVDTLRKRRFAVDENPLSESNGSFGDNDVAGYIYFCRPALLVVVSFDQEDIKVNGMEDRRYALRRIQAVRLE